MLIGDEDDDILDTQPGEADGPEDDDENEGSESGAEDEGPDGEGGEDDAGEAGPDEDGTEEAAGRPADVKPHSRAQRAVLTAKREAREAKERADRLERDFAEFKAKGQTERDKELEAQRVALMSPEEKFEYLLDRQKKDQDARIGQIEFRTWDASDRAAFEAKCGRNPALASVADEVESALANLRREGRNADRETVAKYLIGERALARAARAGGKQRRQAENNRAKQAARPSSGRSNVAAGAERSGDDRGKRAKRLENMSI